MASRMERCSECRVAQVVPIEANIIHCAVCGSIMQLPSIINTLSQPQRSFAPTAAGRFRGPVNNNNSFRRDYGYNNPFNPHSNPPILPQAPPKAPFSAFGRKRALLCGISYVGQSSMLKGSVNDVKLMRKFLIDHLGFPNDSILTLTDEEEQTNPLKVPTKQNMRLALRWLVQGCKSGDSLVFHFSGHSSREVDLDLDEVDGYDEALCPVDYKTQGKLLDDEINATIVRPLPHGVKLHAIIDSCFSGTVLDLPFMCRINREGIMHGKIKGLGLPVTEVQEVAKHSVFQPVMIMELLEILQCIDLQFHPSCSE